MTGDLNTYAHTGDETLHPARVGAPDAAPTAARRIQLPDDPQPWRGVPEYIPTRVRECAIVVNRDGYTILSDNIVVMAQNSLADAIRTAGHRYPRGCVIGIEGRVKGLDIGGPFGAQNKSQTAFWPNNAPIRNLRIIGLNEEAGIEGVTIWDGLGGVDDIRFERLTFWNPKHSKTPFLTAMNQVHGRIGIYECKFKALDLEQFMRRGMMWGWRGHGPAQWDVRHVVVDPCQEHSGYGDNYQGTSYFVDIRGSSNGRTFLQHTNRTTSGPCQRGDLYVVNCRADNISDFGGGGSDYTFVGCMGTVYVEGCSSFGDAGIETNGAMVFWTDTSNGNYENRAGYTTTRAVVKGFTASHMHARRSMLMVSGVQDFELHQDFLLLGQTVSLDLDTTYGGPIKNGQVEIFGPTAPSKYDGLDCPIKARKANRVMTPRELDALWHRPTRRLFGLK